MLKVTDELGVASPPLVLIEEHDPQHRGVGVAVVRRVRALLKGRQLAVPHLVQYPAGVLVAEVIDPRALTLGQGAQRGLGEFTSEWQRLKAGEDAVAAEDCHEPGQPRGGQRVFWHGERCESQRREVGHAALVDVLQRFPVAVDRRSAL